jgi:hypothetical protein
MVSLWKPRPLSVHIKRDPSGGDAPPGVILQGLAGIEAKIVLRREDESAMRDVEVIRWENGKNEIVALFRQGERASRL